MCRSVLMCDRRKLISFVIGVLSVIVIAGCGAAAPPAAPQVQQAAPTNTLNPTATSIPSTDTPPPPTSTSVLPTATSAPSNTPVPPGATTTATAALPTQPPSATSTARPTNTPRPANTPGTPQLTLREIKRQKGNSGTVISYQVIATGFPAGKTYLLAQLPLGGQPQVYPDEFHVDASGKMVSASGPLDAESFDIAQYVKGEALQVALAATDKSVGANTRVIPFPIEAKGNGSCHIAVELVSAKGDMFATTADGFAANEELSYSSQSEGEVIKLTVMTKGDGTWATVSQPAVKGKDTGTDTITLAGKSCSVSVQYVWGKDALKVQ